MRSLLSLFLLVSLLPALVSAQDASLYNVSVSVADHSVEARESALGKALGVVLVRVSGDSDINRTAASEQVREKARRLVRRFSYAGGGEPVEGEEVEPLRLQAEFHPRAVNRAIREANLPLWGGERPNTLVVVSLPDGYVTGTSEESRDFKSAASSRGLPVAFPSSVDARGRVAQADLGPGSPMLASLLQEYDSSHALIGDVRGAGGNWRGNWRIIGPRDEVADAWQSSAGSLDQLQSEAMTHVADVFSRQFSVRPSEGGGSAVVAVDRITGLEDYARVMNYLAGMTTVSSVSPLRITGNSAVFKLELAGSLDNFRRGMNLAGWLAEDSLAQETALLFDSSSAMGYRLTQ